jgi:predicted CoA-binding protein
MSQIDLLVEEFLKQKKVAVVGVSDRRDTGCNLVYDKLKAQGYQVSPVNPRIQSYKGETCFPDLKSIPEVPQAVFILARPQVTELIVNECVDLGVKYVWMHCLLGTRPGLAESMTSVSASAVQLCKDNGIKIIPGSCPNQFLKPDVGHLMMRRLWKLLGFLK